MAYGGHSLRVGGSNFMRRLGIDSDVYRALGGWASLVSSQDYMQLSPAEQFQATRALAVKREREEAFEQKDVATDVLQRIQRLAL